MILGFLRFYSENSQILKILIQTKKSVEKSGEKNRENGSKFNTPERTPPNLT